MRSIYHKLLPTALAQEAIETNDQIPSASWRTNDPPSPEASEGQGQSMTNDTNDQIEPNTSTENDPPATSVGSASPSSLPPTTYNLQPIWQEPRAWQLAADASLYWIGASGGSNNTAANWSTTDPAGCSGTASGAPPGTSDVIIFDPDCDNNMALDVSEDVAGVSFVADYIGTVTQAAGVTLTVGSSNYSQAGGTFSGGNSTIDINGNFTLSGGTFNATSGNIYVSGNWTSNSGSPTFNASTSTVSFDNTAWDANQVINAGSIIFNNVIFNQTGENSNVINITGTMDVDGDLTLTAVRSLLTGTITVAGNVTTTDGYIPIINEETSATIQFNGTGDQVFSGTGYVTHVAINKPSGKLTLQNTIYVARDWTFTQAGSVDAGTSTVHFLGILWSLDQNISASGMSFNNVVFNQSSDNSERIDITGTLDVNGDFTITKALTITGTTIQVGGNLTSSDSSITSTTAITLDGTGDQTITVGTNDLPDGDITINKSSGSASLAAALTVNATGQDITITSGTLSLAGNALNMAAASTFTIGASGTLQLRCSETVPAIDSNSGTVAYTGDGDAVMDSCNLTTLTGTYQSLTVNSIDGATDIFTTNKSALTVNGTLTLTNGTLILEGDETIAASAISSTAGKVMYNGTGASTGLKAGDSYYDLVINNGLVGYWKMDEGSGTTVGDGSGYGYNGGLQANATWEGATKATLSYTNAYSLSLDGTGDYVSTGDYLDVSDTADLTISGWFYRSSATSDDTVLAKSNGPTAAETGYLLYLDDATDQLIFAIQDGTDQYTLTSVTTYTSTGWHHFTVVWDQDSAANSEIFLDGLDDNATDAGTIANIGDASNAVNFAIGAESDAGNEFHGYLDDIRMYDTVLSEQEINSLAAGSVSPTGTGQQVLDAALDVNGDLTLNSGELDVSDQNYAITVAGAWENNGALFTKRAGTVTFDGTSGNHELQIGGQQFNNLTISGSGGTWTLNDDLDVDGTYTQSNGTLNTSTGNYEVHANDFDQTAGTFTPNSSRVTVDSATNQTIQAASSLYSLAVEDPTENGLVGYWKFDEGQGTTAADSSGNGNTGTLTNSPKWSTTVTSTLTFDNPYSLNFDGTNDYVEVAHGSSITPTGDYLVSAWVKTSSAASEQEVVTKFNASGNYPGYLLSVGNGVGGNEGKVCLWVGDLSSGWYCGSSGVNDGVWHQISAQLSGTTVEVFKDGVSGGSATRSPNRANTQVMNIGRRYDTGAYFPGQIDDVRIYNRALSATEVSNLSEGWYADGDNSTATFTLGAALDVDNDVVLQSGVLDVSATPYNATVGGDWSNWSGNSGFVGRSGTVTLDGTTQSVMGTTTFNNLTKNNAGTTLNFEHSQTQTVSGTLTLDGSAGSNLTVRSTNSTTRFTIDSTGAVQRFTYVDVKDANASTNVLICYRCANSGNTDHPDATPHWDFRNRVLGLAPERRYLV